MEHGIKWSVNFSTASYTVLVKDLGLLWTVINGHDVHIMTFMKYR